MLKLALLVVGLSVGLRAAAAETVVVLGDEDDTRLDSGVEGTLVAHGAGGGGELLLVSLSDWLATDGPWLAGGQSQPCQGEPVSAAQWRSGLEELMGARLLLLPQADRASLAATLRSHAACLGEPLPWEDWARLPFEEGLLAVQVGDREASSASFQAYFGVAEQDAWIQDFTPATQAMFYAAGLRAAREVDATLHLVGGDLADLRLDGREVEERTPLGAGWHLLQLRMGADGPWESLVFEVRAGQVLTLTIPGAVQAEVAALAPILSAREAEGAPGYLVDGPAGQAWRWDGERLTLLPPPWTEPSAVPLHQVSQQRRVAWLRGGGVASLVSGALVFGLARWNYQSTESSIGDGISASNVQEREALLGRQRALQGVGIGVAALGAVGIGISVPLERRARAEVLDY